MATYKVPTYTKLINELNKRGRLEKIIDLVSALPSDPNQGDRYIDLNDNKVKEYDGSTWQEYTPNQGDNLYVKNRDKYYYFDGSDWKDLADIISLWEQTGDTLVPKTADNIQINGSFIGDGSQLTGITKLTTTALAHEYIQDRKLVAYLGSRIAYPVENYCSYLKTTHAAINSSIFANTAIIIKFGSGYNFILFAFDGTNLDIYNFNYDSTTDNFEIVGNTAINNITDFYDAFLISSNNQSAEIMFVYGISNTLYLCKLSVTNNSIYLDSYQSDPNYRDGINNPYGTLNSLEIMLCQEENVTVNNYPYKPYILYCVDSSNLTHFIVCGYIDTMPLNPTDTKVISLGQNDLNFYYKNIKKAAERKFVGARDNSKITYIFIGNNFSDYTIVDEKTFALVGKNYYNSGVEVNLVDELNILYTNEVGTQSNFIAKFFKIINDKIHFVFETVLTGTGDTNIRFNYACFLTVGDVINIYSYANTWFVRSFVKIRTNSLQYIGNYNEGGFSQYFFASSLKNKFISLLDNNSIFMDFAYKLAGISLNDGNKDSQITVATKGVVNGFSNLIPGQVYYSLGNSLTVNPEYDFVKPIGIAISETELKLFDLDSTVQRYNDNENAIYLIN